MHQKLQSHDVWFLGYRVRQTKIFAILGQFLPFYLSPPISKFWRKFKKCLEISFYTYTCTINEVHMIHGSWNVRCNRQTFSTFGPFFCPFSPLTNWKIKILTLKKTPGDIIILYICTINDSYMCMVPQIWSATDRFFCHFRPFFALSSP